MNTDDATWTVSPHVRSTSTEDGAVLLDIKKGLCYSLNVVGARVWVTIESSQMGITFEGIVDAVETHFKVPRPDLETDIGGYLSQLEAMSLVHCNGRAQPSKPVRGGS